MLRKATASDVVTIHRLITSFAQRKLLLPRSLSEICESIRAYFVDEQDGEVVACGALKLMWRDLAEIKSLAVKEEYQARGIGTDIVKACLQEARKLEVPRVFTLTYLPEFFERLGFRRVPKESFPQKIWTECVRCPHFPDCKETALALDLAREPETS